MRKKEILTLCLIFISGLALGFFVRFLSLNGFHADTVEQSGFIVARGTLIKTDNGYFLTSASITSGQSLVPVDNVAIISSSPSISFDLFANKEVRVEGIDQDNVIVVMSIYPL